MNQHLLAIDQGTTGTTVMLYDRAGQPVARAYRELPQIYPRPGWVEHDPEAIWQGVQEAIAEILPAASGIEAIGITNQRETTVLWNRQTGRPLHNAIVWQCRRTADLCRRLAGDADWFRARTGLPVDAYFSGTKIRWLLDHVQPDPATTLFGTIDTWLLWKLTGGRVHATDYTNASRTLLFNLATRAWDPALCERLGVPLALLPAIRRSAEVYGEVAAIPALRGVPILAIAGDQQAALFGQTGFAPGAAKNTYGTGCFLLMNTGDACVQSRHGLLTTMAIGADGGPCYAIEGSVFVAGAAIQWLRDALGLLGSAAESESLAAGLPDNAGVYLVPAFTGLGAPHWNMDARGALVGLTRGATRAHVARAALEAMAYQSHDVLAVMETETGRRLDALAVDGGAAANNFLMQFQADLLQRPVTRPRNIETTSQGVAYLAGLQAGIWPDANALCAARDTDRVFQPTMPIHQRDSLLQGWQHALRQTTTG